MFKRALRPFVLAIACIVAVPWVILALFYEGFGDPDAAAAIMSWSPIALFDVNVRQRR